MKQISAIGDPCPLPVIKTKKALGEMAAGTLEVLVDNEIAVENIRKFAGSAGHGFQCEKQSDHYALRIEKSGAGASAAAPEPPPEPAAAAGKTIVVLSSDKMGGGDDELGGILMKGFLFALTQLDALPDTVLLYNGGARLSVRGAPTLEDLIALEKAGVAVMTCGTCLNHFGIADRLGVGEVTNMYSIVEEMRLASRILRP